MTEEIELSPHVGTVVEVQTEKFDKPLYATLISVGPYFCTFERLDGRIISIHKKNILQIQPTLYSPWRKGEDPHDRR